VVSPPVPKKAEPPAAEDKSNEALLSRVKDLETKLAQEINSKKQLQTEMAGLQQRVKVLEDIIRVKLSNP
jgi:molecular chaperone GrpE (heat shock protein)